MIQTLSVTERKSLLKQLHHSITTHEDAICKALYEDFGKPKFEALATETQFVLKELKYCIKNLTSWARPEEVPSTLTNFRSKSYIYQQPYGRVLIFAPWNYPFQLAISPLIGAIAAGNQVVLKPSEHARHTSNIIKKIITEVFDIKQVTVIEGGVELAETLLKQPWDFIFYTGGTQIGKRVYEAAAKQLTPVVLELGGKSPCVVDETANLKVAAQRIVWGKFLNAGQTCIAPDFIVVAEKVKASLIHELSKAIEKLYTNGSTDMAKIINTQHFNRLITYLENQNIVYGGTTNSAENYIAPTLIDSPSLDSKVMQEEIFGPILPIISYTSTIELHKLLDRYQNPLAFYVFSTRKEFSETLLTQYSFGGGCVNDTLVHINNVHQPFGGIGTSGIGAYHGKHSFDTFSHKKSITKRSNWPEFMLRYPPYGKKVKWLQWLGKFM